MFLRKVVNVEEALSKIRDNSVIAISGFNNATTPEYLIIKLYEMWEKTGHPKNLFIESDTLPGTPDRGLDVIGKKLLGKQDQDFLVGILIPYFGFTTRKLRLLRRG
ncbi:MAG: CoA-transferase [Thermoprotei archaeon]|jgi:acyl CoA:acetate/3-ketoacid CoA transferase